MYSTVHARNVSEDFKESLLFTYFCCVLDSLFLSLLLSLKNEMEMSLQDRVAFACTYLEDSILYSYLGKLTKDVMESGQINGLFVTGLTDEGIILLTNFVNEVGVALSSHVTIRPWPKLCLLPSDW